jgi:hypothetical protein
MAGKVVDRDFGYKRFMRGMRKLMRRLRKEKDVRVNVGVHEDAGAELTMIAAVNEFGSSDGRIPERSFLRSTLDERKRDIADRLTAAADAALDGSPLDKEYAIIGEEVAGWVKQKIRDIDTPENAESTIAKKGFDNPLIETGRLRNSIRAEVK